MDVPFKRKNTERAFSMKCICITGAIQSDLEVVSDVLRQAGMKLPKPSNRGDSIDISSWHEQALIMDTEGMESGYTIANPGRFMEQLAGDIFVANNKSNFWGWADVRSTWLLDFWLNFDPRLYFVFVCVSPQQMLAMAMRSEAEIDSVGAVMDAWQAHYQQLLRFHLRNPQRSLLVDASECAENPYMLIERCTEQWKLKIAAPIIADPIRIAHDSLTLYLAHQLCQGYPQVASLQHELAATLGHLGEAEQTANTTPLSPEHIVADYRVLRDRSVEQEQLQAACEELETYVLKHESQQKQINTLQGEVAALITARDEQGSLAIERQAKIDQLTKKHDDTIASHAQQKKNADLKHESQQKQIDALQGEVVTLTKKRDDTVASHAQQKKNADLKHESQQKQIDALQSEVVTLTKKCDDTVASHAQQKKDAEQENELLLQQLHQVQEELEHYFLQHQDKQKELQNAETRWQRVLQRNPDYFDYELIEVLPVENEEGNAMIWRLKNLNIADRSLSEIEFKTIMEQGIAGFVFSRQSDNAGMFTRWLANPENQDELTLIPIGIDDTRQQRIETLLDLATSDWDLLHALARLLEGALQQPKILTVPVGFNSESLRAGLGKLRESIEKIPATLRYNQVTLKREQVTPDYEHLWLRFDNLAFGNKRWPEFEFRLSCTHVRQNDFGSYPKLEFPEESGRAPFEAWFIESYDDFGAKLEWRFALPEAMDTDVWQRISENDRDFLFTLVARLPIILATIQNSGIELKRPWEDWINMAKEIQRILAIRVAHLRAPLTVSQTLTDLEEDISVTNAAAAPANQEAALTIKTDKIT